MPKRKKSLRHNSGKIRWSLLNFKSMECLARVLEVGAVKYSRDNWMIGLTKKEVIDSMFRHLIALKEGKKYDTDTGVHHLGGLLANCMFYGFHFVKHSIDPKLDWNKHLKNVRKRYRNRKK
jgi:hypothetical protein